MKKLIGTKAKSFKVLANRVAKKLNCNVEEIADTDLRECILSDKETDEFVVGLQESRPLTGMEKLSVNYDKDGYSICKTRGEYFVNVNCFHPPKS